MKGLEKFEPETYYHVVNHAVGSENAYRTDDNYLHFLKKYAEYMPSVCSTYCYCLMPNHFHFLIQTFNEQTLLKHPKYKGDFHKLIMQELSNLLNSYTKAYNNRFGRRGALWIDFTKQFSIHSDNYLTSVINYIHQNPVKHGFVRKAEDWLYNSYHSHLSHKATLLARQEVIEWFGGHEAYIIFHRNNTVELNMDWEY